MRTNQGILWNVVLFVLATALIFLAIDFSNKTNPANTDCRASRGFVKNIVKYKHGNISPLIEYRNFRGSIYTINYLDESSYGYTAKMGDSVDIYYSVKNPNEIYLKKTVKERGETLNKAAIFFSILFILVLIISILIKKKIILFPDERAKRRSQ